MFRARLVLSACLIFCLLPALLSAATGTFRGTIVHGTDVNPGWIWVKGADHMLRKISVSGARVLYDNAVPNIDRERQAELSMRSGAEVRVTAYQGSDGEWRASRIEILKIKSAEPVIEPSRRNMDNVRSTI